MAADNEPSQDKLTASSGTILVEKLATPQEMHQKHQDQRHAQKVERRKYDFQKLSASPASAGAPQSVKSQTPGIPGGLGTASELRKHVDSKFAVLKGDIEGQAKKMNALREDFHVLQAFVKDAMSKVATKDAASCCTQRWQTSGRRRLLVLDSLVSGFNETP